MTINCLEIDGDFLILFNIKDLVEHMFINIFLAVDLVSLYYLT